MNKKILAGAVAVAVIAIVIGSITLQQHPQVTPQTSSQRNEKLGLVIWAPTATPSLSDLKSAYEEAASTGIGRNNVYLSWPMVEPAKGQYSWAVADALMGLNLQNNLKVTLYFSIINNRVFGPFPDWMGTPQLDKSLEDDTARILDAILSRYDIVDHVIIGGEIDGYFRENNNDVQKYQDFFISVYTKLKEKHPNVKFGNSFSLHGILNHTQQDLVNKLNQGDFVAFSYFPVNTLNEINKNPQEAGKDLEKILELAGDKRVALMEISWSTAKSINGTDDDQVSFMKIAYDFYRKNEPRFEFLTWFRQYDRPIESCMKSLNTESPSLSFGNEFVIKNTADYICNAGLIDINKNPKPGWEEFKKQVQINPKS